MSEVSNILTSRINLRRLTPLVLDQIAVASSLSPSRNPARTARLEIEVIGCTVSSALVNVAGNVNETFNFSSNGIQIGNSDFTSISGITLSGLSGGFIKIKAISNMGQPINREIVATSNLSCRFFQQNGKIRIKKEGEQEISQIGMMFEPDADIKIDDLVYVLSGMKGITFGQLTFVQGLYDFDGATHHLEADVMQL